MAENESRKLTKEERHEKLLTKQEKDLNKGVFTTVYKINKLTNPKHLFKLDISAKEENLYGICLKIQDSISLSLKVVRNPLINTRN